MFLHAKFEHFILKANSLQPNVLAANWITSPIMPWHYPHKLRDIPNEHENDAYTSPIMSWGNMGHHKWTIVMFRHLQSCHDISHTNCATSKMNKVMLRHHHGIAKCKYQSCHDIIHTNMRHHKWTLVMLRHLHSCHDIIHTKMLMQIMLRHTHNNAMSKY